MRVHLKKEPRTGGSEVVEGPGGLHSIGAGQRGIVVRSTEQIDSEGSHHLGLPWADLHDRKSTISHSKSFKALTPG